MAASVGDRSGRTQRDSRPVGAQPLGVVSSVAGWVWVVAMSRWHSVEQAVGDLAQLGDAGVVERAGVRHDEPDQQLVAVVVAEAR